MIALVIGLIIFAVWIIYTFLLYRRKDKNVPSLFIKGAIVIASCFIGAMIVLPIYAGSLQMPDFNLKVEVRRVELALRIYCSEYDDHLPPTTDLSCLSPYLKDERLEGLINQKNPTIVMNANLTGQNLELLKGKINVPLVYRTEPVSSGEYIVIFTNEELQFVSAGEWDMIKRKMASKK